MKKNRVVSFLLCVIIIFTALVMPKIGVTAQNSSSDYVSAEPVCPDISEFTYRLIPENNPSRAIISAYNGNETKIIFPEYIGEYPVVSINHNATYHNDRITYIKLPATINSVTGFSLTSYSSLETIEVAEGNKLLYSVDGVLYKKNTAGKIFQIVAVPAAKSGKIRILDGISTIGSYAFSGCYNVTEVIMPNSVTEIEAYAFENCWSLSKIKFSDNLRILGIRALAGCNSLKSFDLPATLNEIGADAFLGGTFSDTDDKFYYFTEGVGCRKNSPADYYLRELNIPRDIINKNRRVMTCRTLTDVTETVRISDTYNKFPRPGVIDVTVTPVDPQEVLSLSPASHTEIVAYDITFTCDGVEFTPDNLIIEFIGLSKDFLPTTSKIYHQVGDTLVNVTGNPNLPCVAAQISYSGRFVILTNAEFDKKGDVDGDGTLTNYDVRTIMYASIGNILLTPEQIAVADVDGDGEITLNDARKVLCYVAGISNTL